MSLDQIKLILKKLPKWKLFAITGGEPLLRNDLEEIIIAAKQTSPFVSLVTSGIEIDENVAMMLKRHDVFVQVPFHGLEKTHNSLTRVNDGFRRAIRGVGWLKKYKVTFATTSVATHQNCHELKRVFELGVALGASRIQVIRFMAGGEGLKNPNLALQGREYWQMLQDLEEVCKKYGIKGGLGAPNTPCTFPDAQYTHIYKGTCGAGIDWIAIDPSGRVRICNHSPTILGNLLEQDFHEIWEHPILQRFRNHEIIPQQCQGCDKVTECRGGCRAVAETYFRDLSSPDPLMLCNK